MHIFMTGGSGRNGILTIRVALSRGHSVTALVRNPSTFPLAQHPNLILVEGTPTSQLSVQSALTAASTLPDAVITTLSLRRTSDSPFAPLSPDTDPNFLSAAMRALIDAVHAEYTDAARMPKVVINSSVGVGDSWAAMSLPFKALFSISSMRFGLRDHGSAQAILEASGLPFVLARPVRLTESDAAPVREFASTGEGLSWNPSVSRASVAEWLVDAAEDGRWDGTAPVLAN